VDPADELGIERSVRHAVGPGAVDVAVHLLDPGDHGRGRLGVAEGRAEHVAEGVAGAGQRLGAVGRLLEHAGHHRRVQHLHDDGRAAGGGDAGEVAVDLPRDAAGAAGQAGVARRPVVDLGFVVAAADQFDLGPDAGAGVEVHRELLSFIVRSRSRMWGAPAGW
jgi:hypothetical protein